MASKIAGILQGKSSLGGLILRVSLGTIFLLHGYAILFIYTPSGMAGFMASLGFPLPLASAWLVGLVHLIGGALLILGLWTRLGALAQAGLMLVATVKVHLAQGFFMTGIILDASAGQAIAGGYEYALALTLASLALVFTGPGLWALDRYAPFGLRARVAPQK